MIDIDPFVFAHGYHSQDENLNDQMPDFLQADFRRFMETHQGTVEVVDDGTTLEIVFPDQPVSIQSIEDAVRSRGDGRQG